MGNMKNDNELNSRICALDQAVRLRDLLHNPDEIVVAAEKFYKFLSNDAKPEPESAHD